MENKEIIERFEKRIIEIFDEEVKVDKAWSYGLKHSIKVLKEILEQEYGQNLNEN